MYLVVVLNCGHRSGGHHGEGVKRTFKKPLEPLGATWKPLEPLGATWKPLEPLGAT